MKRKLLLFLTIVSVFAFSSTCFATSYELTRKTGDDGEMHYYMEYSDGSYEEISEDDYYERKYGDSSEESIPNNAVDMGIITGAASSSQESNDSGSIFAGRTQTVVVSSGDVSDDTFENTRKVTNGDTEHYYVFLKDGYYAEITEDLYYLFTYKYERNTMTADESNAIIHDNYENTGHVIMKGFLEDEISGYTIYVRVRKYFGNEEYSYFVYDPDYTIEIDLPAGEYYIMNGGLLNDYTYSYPISNPDFVVEEGKTTNLCFTVGKATIPDEYLESEVMPINEEDGTAITEEVPEEEIEGEQTDTPDEEQTTFSVLQVVKNVVPTVVTIIICVLIALCILKFKRRSEEDNSDDDNNDYYYDDEDDE